MMLTLRFAAVVVNVFPKEMAMIFRERGAKSYRVSAYFIAKVFADQPVRILSLLLYAAIIYWMVGTSTLCFLLVVHLIPRVSCNAA